MHKLLAVALLATSTLASATDTISVARVTPYEQNAATAEVQQKCHWNEVLSGQVAKFAKGRVTVTDDDLSQVSGQVLVMKITHVHTLGGGMFTGPKWARVKGELRDGDKVLGTFAIYDRTIGGGVEGCRVLDKLGKGIAEDIADWLEHPTMMEEEAEEETEE